MATPEIEQATTFTATIGATPVIIVLPRLRAVHIAESGGLVTGDAWTTALLAHGARPMRDTDFRGEPASDWTVTLGPGMATARISGPPGLGEIYDGELHADTGWCERVAGMHHLGMGLVVISGAAESMTADGALEMMEAERAVWVRATTAVEWPSPRP
ncbi:hypothetical protein [Nocardia takedensis]|uniref:hypothetical protein n=1 Tax=Nocardia takedensis TaxID=259390 RepID=UPI0002DD5A83|nr:hypothetical protein [Nocardia takedensis]